MAGPTVRTVSDTFNGRAAREGWGSFCDPELAFCFAGHAALLALWRNCAGANPIPARKDFSLRCLKNHLCDIAIYERVAGPGDRVRYRVRLMGTNFAATMGDLTGKFLDDAIPASFLPRWYAALDAALDARAPLRFVARSHTIDKSFLMAEYFEAPLLNDAGAPTMLLASSRFEAGTAWLQPLDAALVGNVV